MGFVAYKPPAECTDTSCTKMSQNNTTSAFTKTSQSSTPKNGISFSIERILAIESKRQSNAHEPPKPRKPSSESLVDLPWLSYTRYSPPKLPRAKRKKNTTRKSSGNPRVPFSTSQLMTLEHRYLQQRYLSTSEVKKLSDSLSLSDHRIKIWFQNRRAREKKTSSSWNKKTQNTTATVFDHGRHLVPGWLDGLPDNVWIRD